jgi:hypothetical protein
MKSVEVSPELLVADEAAAATAADVLVVVAVVAAMVMACSSDIRGAMRCGIARDRCGLDCGSLLERPVRAIQAEIFGT